jgi:prophage maintenance system killer protein
VDEQEDVILQIAAGQLSRVQFVVWLRNHVVLR